MVTRREKIKRSVCKVQEQIFNTYAKQLEQERVSGTPQHHHSHIRPQAQTQGLQGLLEADDEFWRTNRASFILIKSLNSPPGSSRQEEKNVILRGSNVEHIATETGEFAFLSTGHGRAHCFGSFLVWFFNDSAGQGDHDLHSGAIWHLGSLSFISAAALVFSLCCFASRVAV